MSQENIHVYCYGFDAAGTPFAIFQPEKALNDKADREYFDRWQAIVRAIEDRLPVYCDLQEGPLPQWVDSPENYQKSIVLLFCRMKHLAEAQTYHRLPNSRLRRVSRRSGKIDLENQPVSKFNFQPVITIGERDIMYLYEDDFQGEKDIKEFPAPDACFKFFDSSIWHRYVPLYKDVKLENGTEIRAADLEEFFDHLYGMIGLMSAYHADNLYATNVARSSLELQLRLLKESFIERFGNRGHYKAVTPFKFHSETRMAERTEELLQDFYFGFLKGEKKIKWKMLMVDDYANSPISTFLQHDDGLDSAKPDTDPSLICEKTKKQLIEELIGELATGGGIVIDYPKAKHSNDPLPIDKTEHDPEDSSKTNIIRTCLDYLAEDHYDLILLDYLLGRVNNTEHREFGHEFLHFLTEDAKKQGTYNRGPFGRFWIFPISSFPYAMQDKLRQTGQINFNLWRYLAEGADPISTPQLFRYSLLSFLQHQIQEVLLPPKELNNIINKFSYTSKKLPSDKPVPPSAFNSNLWAKVVAAELNEILLKINLLESNRRNSPFAVSLFRRLSTSYIDMLKRCRNLINQYTEGINSEGSFSAFMNNLNSLRSDFSGDDYAETIHSISGMLDRTGALIDYNYAIGQIEQVISYGDVVLDLNGLRLYGLPPILEKAHHIQELYLGTNHLSTLPSYLSQFNELSIVDLSGNPIMKFPEALLEIQQQLKRVDLRNTQLPELIRILADDLTKIHHLFSLYNNLDKHKWNNTFDQLMSRFDLDLVALANHCINSDLIHEEDKVGVLNRLHRFIEAKKKMRLEIITEDSFTTIRSRLTFFLREIRQKIGKSINPE